MNYSINPEKFIELYDNKRISCELLWKFLLRIVFLGESSNKTKSALKNSIKKKSNATLTYILDVLEDFLDVTRDRDLKGNKTSQKYYELNWNKVIYFLLDLTTLQEEQKAEASQYIMNLLSLLETIRQEETLFFLMTRVL